MAARAVRGKKPSEREQLRSRVAKALGISEEEAELRALRELAASLPPPAQESPRSKPPPAPSSSLPRRPIADGDEYRLAGYLRLRTELR